MNDITTLIPALLKIADGLQCIGVAIILLAGVIGIKTFHK